MMKYHGVQRSAVVIRTLQNAPALVAFVEFKSQFAATVEDEKEALKLFIAERLPRFMYPSLIASLPRFPTSRSGKIDRSILKEIDLKSFAPDLSQELGLPQSRYRERATVYLLPVVQDGIR
jgi:Acyl-CoA synthetases (AMP-forming)/AMP-acid ligases II